MLRLDCALICEICFGLETPIQTLSFQDVIVSAAMKKKQHLSVKFNCKIISIIFASLIIIPLQNFNPEDYRFTAALCILKKLSQRSSNPHPCCTGNSLPVAHTPTSSEAAASPSSGSNSEAKVATPPAPPTPPPPPEVPEEAAQLAMKAAEAFLGSVDHNDIEGSQYQLVSHMIRMYALLGAPLELPEVLTLGMIIYIFSL